jgi:hypothetical protein
MARFRHSRGHVRHSTAGCTLSWEALPSDLSAEVHLNTRAFIRHLFSAAFSLALKRPLPVYAAIHLPPAHHRALQHRAPQTMSTVTVAANQSQTKNGDVRCAKSSRG